MLTKIKLKDIPEGILPLINDSCRNYVCAYFKNNKVKEILIFEEQYKIITIKAEYLFSLDTDITIEVY